MSIPENITRQHILNVITELDNHLVTVPPRQHSTKFCLEYNGIHYAPKYLVRRANIEANGEELWNFGGGPETNNFCSRCHFKIIRHGGAPH